MSEETKVAADHLTIGANSLDSLITIQESRFGLPLWRSESPFQIQSYLSVAALDLLMPCLLLTISISYARSKFLGYFLDQHLIFKFTMFKHVEHPF